MKRFLPYIILIGVILLAVFLRFWQLGKVPVSPDWDEAALGYNAYSILKTGRDEYGTFLPRVLRSYDDYKPPLYAYLTIPAIATFGLNVWAVRLPSAVMGSLAVIGTYFLVFRLFGSDELESASASKKRKVFRWGNKPYALALLATLLLAVSPWHLQFSRIAFEANTGITLNILGLVAFLYGLTSLPWMAVSAFLFGLALYAYHSERAFVPLLVLTLAILWRRELFRDYRKVVVGIIIGLLTVAPLIPVVTDKTVLTRLKGTSSLSDTTGLLMRSVKKLEEDARVRDRVGAIFDNRRIVYAATLIDGYISHYSFRWLFLTGDNDRHHAPDNGLLYLWELPFLLWGIGTVWRKGGRVSTLLFTWFLISPVAASPTSETPHAIRTLVFLPTFQVFTAVGLLQAIALVKKGYASQSGITRIIPSGIALVSSIAILFNILFYFHMYYAHLNYEDSRFWQYGYEQAVRYAEANKSRYKKIVVSTKLEQPHMFFLFYTRYDPAKYLAQGGTASGGFREIRNHFDVYEFRPINDWTKELHDGSILYIGTPKEIPTGSQHSINYLNGEEAMRIAE
jgi:4-amino-4-deoxy-L-arabinose transferase-like glycosyltransferase